MHPFVGREEELAHLEDCLGSPNAQLVIVYGRRRVGKSELILRAMEGRSQAIYHEATEETAKIQLEDFIENVAGTYPRIREVRPAWEPLLANLAEHGFVIAIDEFPYLIQTDPSIPSVFQRTWDTRIQKTTGKLVLIGSSISMMEDKVLSGKSPLHGRRTLQIDLEPLPFGHAKRFFPDYTAEQSVLAWSVFGGTPHYLQAIDPGLDLAANVETRLLSRFGLLYDEPRVLLRSEFERPHTYFSLLDAMARGKSGRNEIAQEAGIDSSSAGGYLDKLQRIRLIKRETPATEDPGRTRQGRYRIRDPLIRFWFRFVHKRQEELARLEENAFQRAVAPSLAAHASETFEELRREALPRLLPHDYTRIGAWWHKEREIDVVGLTNTPIRVVGECKFTRHPVGPGILERLQTTSCLVPSTTPETEQETHHVLFSRSGYSKRLTEIAAGRPDVHLFGLEDVVTALTRPPHQ